MVKLFHLHFKVFFFLYIGVKLVKCELQKTEKRMSISCIIISCFFEQVQSFD